MKMRYLMVSKNNNVDGVGKSVPCYQLLSSLNTPGDANR